MPITYPTVRRLPTDKGKPAARRGRKVYGSRTTNREGSATIEEATPVVGSEDAGTSVAKPGKAKGPKKERAVSCVVHGIMVRVTQAGTDR